MHLLSLDLGSLEVKKSPRHDNDRKLPRTTSEIYMLNRAVASKMESIFTSRGIPVVPSLGEFLSQYRIPTIYQIAEIVSCRQQ